MKNNPLSRLDTSPEVRESLLPFCRLKPGDIWEDREGRHRVGCLDADIDPVYCEIARRRVEHYRRTGKLGWQNGHPFEAELPDLPPHDRVDAHRHKL